MRWASPDMLSLVWTVPVAVVLLVWAARTRARNEAALGDRRALRRRWGAPGSWSAPVRFAFLLAAVAAAALAMGRPQAGLKLVTTATAGPDVVIALDLSESMRARDVRPDRLAAARREIAALLHSLEGSAIGLVEFAGDARVMSPLTTDLEGLEDRIDAATADDLDEPGSNVGAAVEAAGKLLRRPGDRPRAVILVTDGEQLEGDPSSGLSALRSARAMLVAVGVGTANGSTIPVVDSTGAVLGSKRDAKGDIVVTKLAEDALRRLAERAGGHYERGDGSGRAGRRAAAWARGTPHGEGGGRPLQAYDERFHWLAALAAMLLAGEAFVPRRRLR